jgi:hypothetical protein
VFDFLYTVLYWGGYFASIAVLLLLPSLAFWWFLDWCYYSRKEKARDTEDAKADTKS